MVARKFLLAIALAFCLLNVVDATKFTPGFGTLARPGVWNVPYWGHGGGMGFVRTVGGCGALGGYAFGKVCAGTLGRFAPLCVAPMKIGKLCGINPY